MIHSSRLHPPGKLEIGLFVSLGTDLAAYRQTLLNSFQQVEDYLATVRLYSQAVPRQQEAVESSQEFLKLEVVRYETGVDSYLDVLIAQTTLLTNLQNLAWT